MCRFLAYLGPDVSLESLLLAPPWSLLRQSYEPRFMRRGRVNADGFGAGWYDFGVRAEPAIYRRATPIWSDRTFASVAGFARGGRRTLLQGISDRRAAEIGGSADSEVLFAMVLDRLDAGASPAGA